MIKLKIDYILLSLIVAFIFHFILLNKLGKRIKFRKNDKVYLMVYEVVGLILGAKIYSFFVNFPIYDFDLLRLPLSSYGALIGVSLALFLYSYRFKYNMENLVYVHMPSFLLMYSIGKIGCFLNGCCVGCEYSGIGHIVYQYYPTNLMGIKLFPLQIFEAILFFVLFVVVYKEVKMSKTNLKVISLVVIFSGILKFMLEFLRYNNDFNINSNHFVSIVVILIGFSLLISNKK